MSIIELKNIYKKYGKDDNAICALKNVNLVISKGEFWSVMGPSGSGKTTLLNILGCMDKPSEGIYILDGREISECSSNELSDIRNNKLSFIFQNFALLNNYSVIDNIIMPLDCRRMSMAEKKKRALHYLKRLGIETLANKMPLQISGGQQQRVAIARALITEPDIILADEPTGALDKKTGDEFMNLLYEIHKEGKTIILVTHNERIANIAEKKLYIEDGVCVEITG